MPIILHGIKLISSIRLLDVINPTCNHKFISEETVKFFVSIEGSVSNAKGATYERSFRTN